MLRKLELKRLIVEWSNCCDLKYLIDPRMAMRTRAKGYYIVYIDLASNLIAANPKQNVFFLYQYYRPYLKPQHFKCLM